MQAPMFAPCAQSDFFVCSCEDRFFFSGGCEPWCLFPSIFGWVVPNLPQMVLSVDACDSPVGFPLSMHFIGSQFCSWEPHCTIWMWLVDTLFLLVTKESSCKPTCLPRAHSQGILRFFDVETSSFFWWMRAVAFVLEHFWMSCSKSPTNAVASACLRFPSGIFVSHAFLLFPNFAIWKHIVPLECGL